MTALQRSLTFLAIAMMAVPTASDFSLHQVVDVQIQHVSAAPPVSSSGVIVSRSNTILADRRLEQSHVDVPVDVAANASAGIFSSGKLDEVHLFDITPSAGQTCFWTLRLTV